MMNAPKSAEEFWVMDGRANFDIDKATVLVHCTSFEEALGCVHDYGADTCIVKVAEHGQEQEIVYSLLQEEQMD